MPLQLPTAAFIANGGASFVPMINSCGDEAAGLEVSAGCARQGTAKISTTPANAPIIGEVQVMVCSIQTQMGGVSDITGNLTSILDHRSSRMMLGVP
jgi:hypothetical protein